MQVSRKAALHNLGCKVNAYELEAMRQQLEEAGYEIVPFAPGADVYVINTCTVTAIADRKSRQMLHRAKKMNPEALVVAVGCYVQTKGETLTKDPAIDLLIGSSGKRELVQRIEACRDARRMEKDRPAPGREAEPAETAEAQLFREDLAAGRTYEDIRIDRTETRVRAFLKVQDGCDNFCSYCIIPYARGRSRSRRAEEAVAEAERLAANGCREIVLTGIHLCSYGAEQKRDGASPSGPQPLLALIREVASVPGISRVRLGSMEPSFLTEEAVRELSQIPGLCPHFHLSLQSGCDATLRRMNRRYTTADYRRAAELLRAVFDAPALTTDIIVGFPGETEEEFEQTRRFVEEIDFFETHIFPFSRREGTRAAAFPAQIPEETKKRRSEILLARGAEHRGRYLEQAVGREAEVLFEEEKVIDGRRFWCGHTNRYREVLAESAEDLAGSIRRVRIEASDGAVLRGALLG